MIKDNSFCPYPGDYYVNRLFRGTELIAAIQKRINEKVRMKIQQKKASLYILGANCEKCKLLKDNMQQAIKELGADVSVDAICDEKTINSYGVTMSQTPAVVMAKYQLKSIRTIPEIAIIKEWLKDT